MVREEKDMRLVILGCFVYVVGFVLSVCMTHTASAQAVVKKVIVKNRTEVKNGQVCQVHFKRTYFQVPGQKYEWVEEREELCETPKTEGGEFFNRIANFPVCRQLDSLAVLNLMEIQAAG